MPSHPYSRKGQRTMSLLEGLHWNLLRHRSVSIWYLNKSSNLYWNSFPVSYHSSKFNHRLHSRHCILRFLVNQFFSEKHKDRKRLFPLKGENLTELCLVRKEDQARSPVIPDILSGTQWAPKVFTSHLTVSLSHHLSRWVPAAGEWWHRPRWDEGFGK